MESGYFGYPLSHVPAKALITIAQIWESGKVFSALDLCLKVYLTNELGRPLCQLPLVTEWELYDDMMLAKLG